MNSKEIKVSIHQPDFISYLGFYNKINKSDVFVILDDVQISKSGWTHRDQIKTINGLEWLTIPVNKIKEKKKIRQVLINDDKDWRKKHLDLIFENYKNAEFFDEIFKLIRNIYSNKSQKLLDFNINSIKLIFETLNINKKILFLSELKIQGEKNKLLIKILKKLNARYYISGDGARDFLDIKQFNENGLKIIFNKFNHPVYKQLHGNFICNLSIIDILFNCGANKTKEYINYE